MSSSLSGQYLYNNLANSTGWNSIIMHYVFMQSSINY
jgi:hypothetical protein